MRASKRARDYPCGEASVFKYKECKRLSLDGELADGEVGSLLLGLDRQLSGVRRGEFPSEGARLLAADVQGLVHLPSPT